MHFNLQLHTCCIGAAPAPVGERSPNSEMASDLGSDIPGSCAMVSGYLLNLITFFEVRVNIHFEVKVDT